MGEEPGAAYAWQYAWWPGEARWESRASTRALVLMGPPGPGTMGTGMKPVCASKHAAIVRYTLRGQATTCNHMPDEIDGVALKQGGWEASECRP